MDRQTTIALHDRRLLNQVKLGRGTALKCLRQYLDDNPNLYKQHKHAAATEKASEEQQRHMLWWKDAKSRPKRVENSFTERCTHTSVLSRTSTVPNPALMQKAREREAMRTMREEEGGGGGDDGIIRLPQGMLPLPALVRELEAEHAAQQQRRRSQQPQQQQQQKGEQQQCRASVGTPTASKGGRRGADDRAAAGKARDHLPAGH